MKKIEKLNAEIRTYGLQDHSGHIYDAIVLNNEGLNTEQALKRIADKVDELIDAADNQLANGGNCHAIEDDPLTHAEQHTLHMQKENERLKAENEELKNDSRKPVKFEDVRVGKSYLLKTKFGYFAGEVDSKHLSLVEVHCEDENRVSPGCFGKSEIESIEELPE